MAKADLFKLEKHPFFMEVSENCISLIGKIFVKTKDLDEFIAQRNIGRVIDSTPQEDYSYVVFKNMGAVSDVFRNLRYSLVYISELDSPQKHEKYGIHKFHYLTYQYAIYVLSYVSILDISLILTNTVFQLGFSDEKCKYDTVVSKIADESICANLKNIKTLVRKYSLLRNRYVHHGKLPDIVDINNSEVLFFLRLFTSQSKLAKKLRSDYRDGINSMYKTEALRMFEVLNLDVALVENAVSDLLNDLLPIYRQVNTYYAEKGLK